jgi:hypothetical protein
MVLKSLEHQVTRLHELFPDVNLGSLDEDAVHTLSQNGYRPFVFPIWQLLAPTYADAVKIVLGKLNEMCGGKFRNLRQDDEITSFHLRETEKKSAALSIIVKQQKGCGLVVVRAQFGSGLHGLSASQARIVVHGAEFCLGAFETGIMFLTHQTISDMSCVGDTFRARKQRGFSRPTIFFVRDGILHFGVGHTGGQDTVLGKSCAFNIPSASISIPALVMA